jgi:hypothetical protein
MSWTRWAGLGCEEIEVTPSNLGCKRSDGFAFLRGFEHVLSSVTLGETFLQ